MLVLSRKTGEVITIGDDIRIVVVGIVGERVRIGIDAPAAIPVHRLEVAERIEREQNESL